MEFPTLEIDNNCLGSSIHSNKSSKSNAFDYEPSFYKPANLDGPLFAGMDLSFHPDEVNQLKQIVKKQEQGEDEEDIVDLLLFILDEVAQSDDFVNVLSNLAEEFGRILGKGEVYKAYSIIEKIADYRSQHAWLNPMVDEKVDSFIKHISGPVFQNSLSGLIPVLNRNNPGDIFFLRKICMALESKACVYLCDIVGLLKSKPSRDTLLDIIKDKAREDAALIDQMMASSDSMVVLIAISLLKNVKDTNSDFLLYNVLKHTVEQVRSHALDYFLEKPVGILNRIFFLINDPSMEVRIKLLKFIGSKRSVPSETLMLQYLDQYSGDTEVKSHLMTCYRMLGKCGSDRSISFLRKKVFKGAWTGLLGINHNNHREGALLALSELGSMEALKVLKKASKSRSPIVRKAFTMFTQ